jgi:hypothetical protein
MSRITLNPRSTTVVNGNQNPASIRAIVRTSGMNGMLHYSDYTGTQAAG